MKKILALTLSLLMLLPLAAGCASSLEGEALDTATTEAKTEAKTEEAPKIIYPEVPEENRLSWEKIHAIPIADSSMSEDELRKICVDFFRLSQTFAWTPAESWDYTIGSSTKVHTMAQGTVYGGFPYLHGAGNIYRLMDYYDEKTGIVDIKEAGTNQRYFGNFCSYGSGWGFSRVVNSAKHGLTESMVPKNGYIPLGNYKMNMELDSFPENETVTICAENGKEVMFESYALLKPADALVYYTTGGHILMCSSVYVERGADGKIDGEKSYITFLDQATNWRDYKLANDKNYKVQGGVDQKKSFASCFNGCYIPYTFAEFLGTDPVEKGEAVLDLDKTEVTLEELRGAKLTANYMISDVYVDFMDESGKTVTTKTLRTGYGAIMTRKLEECIFIPSLKKYADGKHSAKVTCRIGNGELITAWEGRITGEK